MQLKDKEEESRSSDYVDHGDYKTGKKRKSFLGELLDF